VDKRRSRSKELGQNFLRSGRLAAKLVALSSITKDDIVCEIGAGRGVLTEALSLRAARVIAIEKDPMLARMLRRRFAARRNVEILECDVLKYKFRERPPFKIFSSVPYGITARVMNKVLYERPLAHEIYLIVQREAAEKYSGMGRRGETMQSVRAKVHFDFEVIHRLRREDFVPMPAVDSVMIRIKKRPVSLLTPKEEEAFGTFVMRGFCAWKPSLRLALKKEFSYRRWKRLSRELGFALNARPSDIRFEQWLALFRARLMR